MDSSSSESDDTIDLGVLEEYVAQTLPSVSAKTKSDIVTTLLKIGVGTPADLQYVNEEDFNSEKLKLVQVRKLMKEWNKGKSTPSSSGNGDHNSSTSSLDIPGCSSIISSEESSAEGKSTRNEARCIPWHKMPEELMTSLKHGRRPSPSLRKEMVRIVIADLYNLNLPLPRTTVLRALAQEAVRKYPNSLRDEVDGMILGSGYDSLLSQFLNRVDNVSRPRHGCHELKRKADNAAEADSAGSTASNQKRDSYGCLNWQPLSLPEGETEESQMTIKEELKELHKSEPHVDRREVETKMAKTYASQRISLNKPDCALLDVVEEWPYLFDEKILLLHFKQLVGMDAKEKITEGLERKSAKMYRFFRQSRSFGNVQDKRIHQVLNKVDEAVQMTKCESSKVMGLVYLVSAYGGEEVQHYIYQQDLGQPQQTKNQLPGHPCLISKGDPLESTRFSLAVGGIVTTHVENPISALAVWFAAFYVFNLQYPKEASGVPEFIQRCFLGINPQTGSKGGKRKMHPGILKLANRLMSVENEWALNE